MVLNLTRKLIGNKELVCFAITQFSTCFISIQSLIACMLEVKRMFIFDERVASPF